MQWQSFWVKNNIAVNTAIVPPDALVKCNQTYLFEWWVPICPFEFWGWMSGWYPKALAPLSRYILIWKKTSYDCMGVWLKNDPSLRLGLKAEREGKWDEGEQKTAKWAFMRSCLCLCNSCMTSFLWQTHWRLCMSVNFWSKWRAKFHAILPSFHNSFLLTEFTPAIVSHKQAIWWDTFRIEDLISTEKESIPTSSWVRGTMIEIGRRAKLAYLTTSGWSLGCFKKWRKIWLRS